MDWERGKGATLPLPRLKLGLLRSPNFFAAYFTAEPGTRLKDLKPKLNTENLKGVKIGKTGEM